MPVGDNQNMGWRNWMDIMECGYAFVLENLFAGQVSGNDLAENALIHEYTCESPVCVPL